MAKKTEKREEKWPNCGRCPTCGHVPQPVMTWWPWYPPYVVPSLPTPRYDPYCDTTTIWAGTTSSNRTLTDVGAGIGYV